MSDTFKFDIIQKAYKTASLNLMREIAMANKNYFLDNFKVKQGWGSEQWQEVQRRIPGTNAYMYPAKKGLKRRTRPILVGKGSLRRAVNASIKLVTTNRVYFRVDLPYAAVHNEGSKRIPKRQYMGMNRETNVLNKNIIKKYASKAFEAGAK
jgi:phage gpG-like protein